ncbi:hypothetical protein NHQ30_003573 [Ciborinia camelliae]|nr:hypothetical protein NHQ30_003573 [Ciborinia camelliae]
MGNKNARGKKSFDLPNLTLPSSFTADKISEVNASAVNSPKSPLAFKSFRQGTLITPNFETLGKSAAKSLSATSAEFVPALPLKIAPFPKVAVDTSSGAPATEKLHDHPEMVNDTQLTGTPRHIYTELRQLENTSKLPMEMGVGVIPANRIHEGGLGLDQMAAVHPFGDGMNTLSVSSASSTPEKTGSSSFVTPTKPKETPLSTPSPVPTGPRPEKPRFGRADKKKKDIIITQFGVIRNLARITDRFTENGFPYKHACADEFQPAIYDVADVVRNMPIEERKEFWSKNWIDIEVDLRPEEEIPGLGINAQVDRQEHRPRDYDTLLRYIDYLGLDFAANAKYIFISILFPSIPDADQSKINSSVLHCQQTPEFQHLEKLVAKLQRFPKIKRLDIILQTPSNTKKPLSIPQLNLVLPFYDLAFTDWNIKWKTTFMTKAEPVGGWPIHYLDKERNRLLRERERVKNAVFVRKSQFIE